MKLCRVHYLPLWFSYKGIPKSFCILCKWVHFKLWVIESWQRKNIKDK